MKLLGSLVFLGVCLLGCCQVVVAQNNEHFHKMEYVSILGSDGKKYSLSELSGGKPIWFVFFSNDTSDGASRTFRDWNKIYASLKGRVRVVGILARSKQENKDFIKSAGLRFLTVWETNSLSVVRPLTPEDGWLHQMRNALVLSDGSIVHVWDGYSRQTVSEAVSYLRKYAGVTAKLDLNGLPKKLTKGSGVTFGL